MNKINEDEFAAKLEKIKNSKPKTLKKHKNTQGENMKNIKKINWNKIIETIKTIALVALLTLPIGIYIGVEYQKQENAKMVEIVRNLNQK